MKLTARVPPRQALCRVGRCVATAASKASSSAKPWRLSASVVIAAPSDVVPTSAPLVPGDDSDYRVCLVQRTPRSTFMPSVSVFPGGAVDASDSAAATKILGRSDVDATCRVAAAREAFEESGILLSDGSPAVPFSRSESADWRARFRAAASSAVGLFAKQGVGLSLEGLHPICSFVTPVREECRAARP
eukprot:SAG11_NODE_950_length_6408_cov_2.671739_3_plen_189_part_00